MLTIALAGSRHTLDHDRHELVWAAFLDIMYTLRDRLPEPPPYCFLIAELSSVDRFLADQLAAAGRQLIPVTVTGGDRSPAAVLHQLRVDLQHADTLAAVWDARVHEPIDLLRAAATTASPERSASCTPPAPPYQRAATPGSPPPQRSCNPSTRSPAPPDRPPSANASAPPTVGL